MAQQKRDTIAAAVAAAYGAEGAADSMRAVRQATKALARYPGEAELQQALEQAKRGKAEVRGLLPLPHSPPACMFYAWSEGDTQRILGDLSPTAHLP